MREQTVQKLHLNRRRKRWLFFPISLHFFGRSERAGFCLAVGQEFFAKKKRVLGGRGAQKSPRCSRRKASKSEAITRARSGRPCQPRRNTCPGRRASLVRESWRPPFCPMKSSRPSCTGLCSCLSLNQFITASRGINENRLSIRNS